MSSVAEAEQRASYADVEAAPADHVAEIVDGELHSSPRPAARHARAASRLGYCLGGPFDHGVDGPGGWILLDEPELHLAEDVLVPDLAGWRRERLPELPDVVGLEVVPDWVCEILSPSTALLDRRRKLPAYGRHGVPHVWLIDPRLEVLEVFRRSGEHWLLVATHGADEKVRAEPFEAFELDLALLWER